MKTLLLHQYNAIMGFREIAHAMKRSIFLPLATSPTQSQTQRRRLKTHTAPAKPRREGPDDFPRAQWEEPARLGSPWLTAFIGRKPFN